MTKVNTLDLYTIRAAREEDAVDILEIYNERIENSTGLFMYEPVPLENRLNWFKDTKSKGYPLIVAVDNTTNKVAAYASYGLFRPHTAYILTTEISLYVHQQHHRRGLGAILLGEMLRIAEDMKLRNIIAGITSDNEPSVLLFNKFGFKNVGHLHDVGYKFGNFRDVLFLEYITKATPNIQKSGIPSFKPFNWSHYVFGGPSTQ
ncbi:acyl-CoA N-acyltransferase [Pilobolus umbonatus]|nr:acyl-CoA N-acyltransferase [Pilobolus umbonatus]